jgi:hypothetical protein
VSSVTELADTQPAQARRSECRWRYASGSICTDTVSSATSGSASCSGSGAISRRSDTRVAAASSECHDRAAHPGRLCAGVKPVVLGQRVIRKWTEPEFTSPSDIVQCSPTVWCVRLSDRFCA